eukprot:471797_1
MEVSESSNSQNNNETLVNKNKKLYFFIYALLYFFHGALLSLPGAIYIELQIKLNTSTTTISWIYSSMSISSALFAFISAYITDKFESTQKYLSLMVFLECVMLITIPFVTNTFIMFMLFIVIGAGFSSYMVCGPVFIFRLYPQTGQHVFFVMGTILSISSMITPLMIQLSINKTNNYYIPLIMLSLCAFMFSVISFCLPTPSHDPNRSISRKMIKLQNKIKQRKLSQHAETKASDTDKTVNIEDVKSSQLTKAVSNRLNKNKRYQKLQNILIMILIICMILHRSISQGTNSFITTYCINYLHIDEAWGRYLISTYWSCGMMYRVMNVMYHQFCTCYFGCSIKYKITHMYAILIGFIMRTILTLILWILFSNKQVIMLFVVFGMNGFFGSPTVPGLIQWAESITSVTGFIQCMFAVSYSIGPAIISPILGTLMQQYSAGILPYVLLVPTVIGTILVVISVVLYKQYKVHEIKTTQRTSVLNACDINKRQSFLSYL